MRELDLVLANLKPAKKQKRMKLRIPRGSGLTRVLLGPAGRIMLIGFAVIVILSLGAFIYFYSKYSRLIDEKLRVGVFANTAKIYAAPLSVAVGDTAAPADL